jgi:hypothetical protein
MVRKSSPKRRQPKGAIIVLFAICLPAMIGMLALAIDCGNLLRHRANLQRGADAAALAGVRDLIPDIQGNQDLGVVRNTIREYTSNNVTNVESFTVLDSDIEIGRYDPETIYSNLTILDSGVFDTVRVTLRRDSSANSPITLFFAGVFGIVESDVAATATAVLQKASIMEPGADVLPIVVPQNEWNAGGAGDTWSIYGDGKLQDGNGNDVPGNWGTLDIGSEFNSTSDMRDQIVNGLDQTHLDALYGDGRILQNTHLDSSQNCYMNGDPGLSAGMKFAIQEIQGQSRIIPLIDSSTDGGGNLEFHVVGWAVCVVGDSAWNGNKNTHVNIQKSFMYDGLLKPNPDLSVTEGVIEGAFTTPALVE